ncbi:hypothetical protein [Desulfobaculum sp.]
MSVYSETMIDTSGRHFKDLMGLLMQPRAGWTEVNLPWNRAFWEALTPATLARLNPHWELSYDEKGSMHIYDHLLDVSFVADIDMHVDETGWAAHIAPLGVAIMARPQSGECNTLFNYAFTGDADITLSGSQAEEWAFYWLRSLREYLRVCVARGPAGIFWRFFMRRCWLRMSPPQRRISLFMIKLTLMEMVLIVALGVGYWAYVTL